MSNKVIDMCEHPNYKFTRIPIKKTEEATGCSHCGGFLFAVISTPDGAILRCSRCYKDVESVALIGIANDQPVVVEDSR